MIYKDDAVINKINVSKNIVVYLFSKYMWEYNINILVNIYNYYSYCIKKKNPTTSPIQSNSFYFDL